MKKRRRLGILTVFTIILMCFFYRFILNGKNDYDEHYRFAFDLLKLRELPLKEFLIQTEFSHILAYPLWHAGFLFVYYIIRGILHILSLPIGMEEIYSFSAAVVCAACVICTYVIVQKIFARYFVKKQNSKIIFLAMAVMFVGPLYLPGVFSGYYVGPRTCSIWHNPTYLIVKPFAVLIFFLYYEIFKEYAKAGEASSKKINRQLFLVSVVLFISAIAKPNFYQIFLPGLVLYCLIELIRSRGRSFFFLVKIALSVVPVTITGLIQIVALNTSSQESGIGIGFLRVWTHWTPHWFIALIISVTFPIGVMLLLKKDVIRDKMVLLALSTFMSGMLQYMFLFIKKAPFAGDFGWGFNLAIFLFFIVSIIKFENMELPKGKRGSVLYNICKVVFALHFICGIIYFYDIFKYLEFMNPLSF